MAVKSVNRAPTPNGRTEKIVRHVFAKRKGTSSLGTKFKKGDPIIHMFSTRATGEVFILVQSEAAALLKTKPVEWTEKYPERKQYMRKA